MKIVNELSPDLLSTAAFNIKPGAVSGSRLQMAGTQLTQMVVIKGATPRRIVTGVEREYGKYTFKVKMPVDAIVIDVIPKYHETVGQNAITSNPMSIVIYENVDTREICILEIPQYHIKHQYLGFRYAHKRTLGMLSKGATIPKGTVFADSPAIDDNGDYRFGVEANVAFMTIPGVIEDGFVISESFAKKLTATGYETLDASWGKRYYPLNIYGDDTHYKPFPDIGERVRPDGLLFALREYDELLDPVQMTPAALRRVDTFDKTVYTKANAKVVDIVTRYDPKGSVPETPTGMEDQTRRYHTALLAFYNRLLAVEEKLRKEARHRKTTLNISTAFSRLLVEALTYRMEQSKVKATRIVRRQPLNEWRVDITVEYDIEATQAMKITDLHGGKGVVVAVWPDENCPVDKHGTRADIIADPGATMNRTNYARLYEHYINATSDQLHREITEALAHDRSDAAYQRCFDRLLRYYEILSPRKHSTITSSRYKQTPRQHVDSILPHRNNLRIFLPTDNEVDMMEAISQLSSEFPIDFGPVSYIGASGNRITTIEDVMIASMYIIMLEKTGSDWSAVSSGTLQQHGILSKLTQHDKHSRGGRANPTRTVGEDETRLLLAATSNNYSAQKLVPKYGPTAADGQAVVEMMDLSNNPAVHQEGVRQILKAESPTRIQTLIDRNKFPLGGNRALRLITHHLEIAGMYLTKTDDSEMPANVYNVDQLADDGNDLEEETDE